ncbi:MAG: alpha-mannosidase [Kastovskya adunca ATA6-11-RM4]|nr:alpha-mannosidase [Kastovskya adunca ATA6-11-RM4]
MTTPATPTTATTQINCVITQLRSCTQIPVQSGWRCYPDDLPASVATQAESWEDWSTAPINDKGYIVWASKRQVMWLAQRFVVPQNLQGYPLAGLTLRLVLTWWAEDAQIFVNGQFVQAGDLFDSSTRVVISQAVTAGEEITVTLRLVSPGHDIGALMRSHCLYEAADGGIDPGFVADELAVLWRYQEAFEPESLEALAAAVAKINWEVIGDREKFHTTLSTWRQHLFSSVGGQQNRCIQMLGHAHLDLAWLWTVSETWEVAQRTFESVLNLQKDFPELTFCHSTPALYAWIEEHRPDLFAAIKQQIAAGRWEVVGGMWVEPELNLIDGESIVRQVLYAQQYVQEKFGKLTKIAWVPDSFGFCWQLPQILRQGGIEYFVTQKLHWNDSTKFPYGAFWWRSPDGSQIFSLISPPNTTGVMDTSPLTMASYAVEWETQTKLKDIFWLPGVGDHGGGPTRDMLQVAQRWQQSPFFPRLEFTTALGYLQQLTAGGKETNHSTENAEEEEEREERSPVFGLSTQDSGLTTDFPLWNDELYLEFHRGCYTTHADQKRWNRRCEQLLYQGELFASLATLIAGTNYPKLQLETAWKTVLFNQFHDILPGTSIPEVFVAANQGWQEVEQVASEILADSLKAIASQISLLSPPQPNAQPLIVFNSLNWQRSEVVAVPLPAASAATWSLYDLSGEKLPCQFSSESPALLFLAQDVPSVGYRIFWLCRTDLKLPIGSGFDSNPAPSPISGKSRLVGKPRGTQKNTEGEERNQVLPEDFVLENALLRVVVSPESGDLSSVFDKIHQQEILQGAGNQLQAFQDKGQYWDAWNIDPNYGEHPLPPTELVSIQWLERGPIQWRLRVVRQLNQSEFCQDYVLQADSAVLKIATTVDWQESHVLVKAAFPLNLEVDYATYEIACGAIQRPTRPQTPAEKAKWEVPALRWADLGDQTSGVSLLNDCKYGYDAQSSQLRLTLLRSPCWPDPTADRGIHHFTYALYPHRGSWQSANTVRRGYELNLPLHVVLDVPANRNASPTGDQPGATAGLNSLADAGRLYNPTLQGASFLDLSAENLVLIAFKQSEDDPHLWVLRCYECQGQSAELSFKSSLDLAIAHPVNLLEQPTQSQEILPWKITSFAVQQGYSDPKNSK